MSNDSERRCPATLAVCARGARRRCANTRSPRVTTTSPGTSNPPASSPSSTTSAPFFSAAARCAARRPRAASSSSGLRTDSALSSANPGSGELWKVPSGTSGGAGIPVKI